MTQPIPSLQDETLESFIVKDQALLEEIERISWDALAARQENNDLLHTRLTEELRSLQNALAASMQQRTFWLAGPTQTAISEFQPPVFGCMSPPPTESAS